MFLVRRTHRYFACRIAAALAVTALSAADGTAGGPFIPLGGDVFDGNGGPLVAGTPYHAVSTITVPPGQTLTIQAGAVIKFGLTGLVVNGTLDVQGTSQATVHFTSVSDDSVGGDSNQDGVSQGSPDDWLNIHFSDSSDASTLANADIRFAGAGSRPAVRLQAADITLSDTRIHGNSNAALDLSFNSRPAVSGCSFDDSKAAVENVPLEAVPFFVGNSASGNQEHDSLRVAGSASGPIVFDGALALARQNTLNDDGVLLMLNDLLVQAGDQLTLDPGLILKFEGGSLQATGTLIANGSESDPVVFTSLEDDAHGGDSNNDLSATSGAPGQWGGMLFSAGSGASALRRAIVRFAGGMNAGVRLTQADITLENCVIEQAEKDGLDLSENSRPTVVGCAIDGCGQLAVDAVEIAAVPGFAHNTASGNGAGDYMRVTHNATDGNTTILPFNYPGDVLVLKDSLTVIPGSSLTLGPGVQIKMDVAGIVHVNGTLEVAGTGLDPVVITDIRDDEVAGDTNKDGGATVPFAGAWSGVSYTTLAAPAGVRHLTLRYAGLGQQAFFCQNPAVALDSVRVDESASAGFRLDAVSGDVTNPVAWNCGGDGMLLLGGSFDILHATVAGCAGFGFNAHQNGTFSGRVINSIAFACQAGGFNGFGPGDVVNSNGHPGLAGTDGNIDADPLFADLASGDLTLLAGSPSLNAGNQATAKLVAADHADASRIADHDLSGIALADMGAFEKAAYRMDVAGVPLLGTNMTFTVQGPPAGQGFFFVGPLDGVAFFKPYGMLLIGVTNLFPVPIPPVGSPALFPIPDEPSFSGLTFGVQAIALSQSDPSAGNLTNAWSGTLTN